MDQDTLALVRSSWSQVTPIAPAAAAMFYRHLFDAAPELRPLFRGDLQRQGDKLVQMLDWLVARLDAPSEIAATLEALGRRHAGYGVKPSHYDRVGTALLRTLADGLGPHFTPAVERAWAGLYQTVADTMIAATDEVA